MSSLQRKAVTAGMPRGLPPRCPMGRGGRGGAGGRGRGGRNRVYTPIHWKKYFKNCHKIQVGTSTFNAYQGGDIDKGPLLVFLHGGGYSGLTWALLNEEITRLVECHTLAIDLRGHGSSKTVDDYDLSAEVMAEDVSNVVEEYVKLLTYSPEIVLIGHSMGGALAVHTALLDKINGLVGVVVVDVVEGTALDALSSMQSFLRGRPKNFPSIDNAVEWALRTAQVKNVEAARVSMPGQLVNSKTGECACNEVPEKEPNPEESQLQQPTVSVSTINEEEDDAEESNDSNPPEPKQFKSPSPDESNVCNKDNYIWRIDLSKTETHWTGWFTGLSNKLLSVPASKMLILAGVDRLDRDLTIGQMQGKFQMQVLPQAGHAVHEDAPEKMAEAMATFLIRNKFAQSKEENFTPMFPGC